VERHCRVEQDTDDNMAHAHCMLDTQDYNLTVIICNTHCFSTPTIITRTLLGVTLYLRGLFRKLVPFRCKTKSNKVSYKILLLSDSTFFKLFFHIFAAIIEALIVAEHKFLCTLLIECGRLRC